MPKNNNTNKNETPKFNDDIGFWPSKSGKGYNVFVDEKILATLATAQEGDRLFLSENTSENPKAPAYRVAILKSSPAASADRDV